MTFDFFKMSGAIDTFFVPEQVSWRVQLVTTMTLNVKSSESHHFYKASDPFEVEIAKSRLHIVVTSASWTKPCFGRHQFRSLPRRRAEAAECNHNDRGLANELTSEWIGDHAFDRDPGPSIF
jgi:hypothetical protein